MLQNPFINQTNKPFIIIKGLRNGYIQIAQSTEALNYSNSQDALFILAKKWCELLEAKGAKRVYWFILSEMVKQIHIHLYPRWADNEVKGIDLFNQREGENQLLWTNELDLVLQNFANENQIHVI